MVGGPRFETHKVEEHGIKTKGLNLDVNKRMQKGF